MQSNLTGRLFLAYWPDPACRKSFSKLAKQLSLRNARLIKPENIHLTLVFLGHVDEKTLPQLTRSLETIATEPIELVFDQLGWWQRSQVIWVAPASVPDNLLILVDNLNSTAHGCGFKVDERPYSPHITLARKVRQPPVRPEFKPVTWLLRDWVLVRSETLPEGARYTPIWSREQGFIGQQN
ncbi:MAG TPA: RNA 2',3'-cyclic phosphodiesterase [Gammaproteobacteria bacterium]